jgi:hypothetical protein
LVQLKQDVHNYRSDSGTHCCTVVRADSCTVSSTHDYCANKRTNNCRADKGANKRCTYENSHTDRTHFAAHALTNTATTRCRLFKRGARWQRD